MVLSFEARKTYLKLRDLEKFTMQNGEETYSYSWVDEDGEYSLTVILADTTIP